MSSEKQIRASRTNGAKSKGPKTPEGKRRSSRNNLRHGILAADLLTDIEDGLTFTDLYTRITAAFQPDDGASKIFVENMIAARWRSLRTQAMETANLQKETHNQMDSGQLDPDKNPDLTTQDCLSQAFNALSVHSTQGVHHLDRYETRYDRQFNQNLNLLLRWRAEKRAAQKHKLRQEKASAKQ